MFVPIINIQSALSTFIIEFDITPDPTVEINAGTVVEWQNLEQLSKLFVFVTHLANFWIIYKSSFVILPEFIKPISSGGLPFSLFAISANASSQEISLKLPFFFISGVFNLSSLNKNL